MNRTGGVCVFSERQDVVLELLSPGRALADSAEVVAIVPATNGAIMSGEPIAHGADAVFIVEPRAGSDPVEAQLEALRQVLARCKPDVLLVGATVHGTEIAARLAQRLGVGCASECTRLERRDGKLVIERTCLGGFVAQQVIETRPAIATVQPRRFEPLAREQGRPGHEETLSVGGPASRSSIVDTRPRRRSSVRIDRADVVVGVGRGLRSKDDLRMIERLATSLGGVVGASRPLTDDLQWLGPDRKIGLSGVTVKPRLYIACGISGQIEHHVGMRESGVVVAINSDPAAPIMRQADYCVTGDLHEIVPELIDAIGEIGRR